MWFNVKVMWFNAKNRWQTLVLWVFYNLPK